MLSPNILIKPLHLVESEKLLVPRELLKQPCEGPRTRKQNMGHSRADTGHPVTSQRQLEPALAPPPTAPNPTTLQALLTLPSGTDFRVTAGRISLAVSLPGFLPLRHHEIGAH